MSLAKIASDTREKDLIKITEEHGLVIKYGSSENEGYLFLDGSVLKLEGVNQEYSSIQEPKKSFRLTMTKEESGESVISIQDCKLGDNLPTKIISKTDLSFYDNEFGSVEKPEGIIPMERRTIKIYQDGVFIENKTDENSNETEKTYTKEMVDEFLQEMGLSGNELNMAIKQKIEVENDFDLINFLGEKFKTLNPFSDKKKNEKRNKNKRP